MAVVPHGSGDGDWNDFSLGDSDDELEGSSSGEFSSGGRTALLVLIDATPSMFEKWGDNEETPFVAAIKCCEAMWKSKVLSNPRDIVSILLVGTEDSSKDISFPNIYELFGFSVVKAEMIQKLMEMRSFGSVEELIGPFGSSLETNLKDVFWQAKMSFDKAKAQSYLKKIQYFTCEDNPHGKKPTLQSDAIGKFKDLGTISFNVVSFKEEFDYEKFYRRLVDEDTALISAHSQDLEALTKIVRMRQRLRRPYRRLSLELTPQVKIGVGIYPLIRKAIIPKAVNINRTNNQVVQRTVNQYRTETGMPVLKSEHKKMVTIGDEVAVFEPQEIKEIKATAQVAGLKLIAFVNKGDFDSIGWYSSSSYFLYPDEEHVTGSKDVFTTLLRRCHALGKLILVRYMLTRRTSVKLGMLVPEMAEEGIGSVFPQGFHLLPLPFADESRKHEVEESASATPELIDLMSKVVRKLTKIDFDAASDVKNPSLQVFLRRLEEEALEERAEEDDEFFDMTDPQTDMMKTRLKTLPAEITKLAGPVAKRFRPSAVQDGPPQIDIEMEARHGRLMNCKTSQLEKFLKDRGVSLGWPRVLRKADLIRMVNSSVGYGA